MELKTYVYIYREIEGTRVTQSSWSHLQASCACVYIFIDYCNGHLGSAVMCLDIFSFSLVICRRRYNKFNDLRIIDIGMVVGKLGNACLRDMLQLMFHLWLTVLMDE